MNLEIIKKNRGYTLIEVLTTLTLIVLIFGLLLSGLIFANTIQNKTKMNQELFYKERYINLYFQKQILESDQIFIKNKRIYLQDLESPEKYYNYYRCINGRLKRYKVYRGSLSSIGLGSSSQFLNNITEFSLGIGENNAIILSYTLIIDGRDHHRETVINYGKLVEYR
jgi:prepilin-type N-terminal cleavage/methylation domain-containing protein